MTKLSRNHDSHAKITKNIPKICMHETCLSDLVEDVELEGIAFSLMHVAQVPLPYSVESWMGINGTDLGVVPFFFVELDPQWIGICNGMVVGVMLATIFDLLQEGQSHGSRNWVVIGILPGCIFMLLCQKFLEQYGEASMLDIKGVDVAKVVLVIGIMTLHSIGKDPSAGVSFANSKGISQGLLITLAMVVLNIPEELAVSMVLASMGISPQNAMFWIVITSFLQPIVVVPSCIYADTFNKFLPFCTDSVVRCMIRIVVLPDAFKAASPS